jgi:adenine/guanine phosphoribosyltransferase-like PRPP-binding protein
MFASPAALYEAVEYLKDVIEEQAIEFDAIVVRGVSGAVIGGALSLALRKQLTVVRKRGVDCHSEIVGQCEGLLHAPHKYLIVDDFVATGKTLAHIVAEVGLGNAMAECVGFIPYHNDYRDGEVRDLNQATHRLMQAAMAGKFDPTDGSVDDDWDRAWHAGEAERFEEYLRKAGALLEEEPTE